MKKAILIGKFNEITKEVSAHLSEQYHVQLCAENKEILTGILQMTKPDLIIGLLTGITMSPDDMLCIIFRECPGTPLIVVGNNDDRDILNGKGYLDQEWVKFLKRPVKAEKICAYAEELLDKHTLSKEEREAKEREKENKKPTVLLVDDSPPLLRSMQAILSPRYKVIFATSGFQAIQMIAKTRPDIILLDYEMPICDGKVTLQMLRAEDATKDIPVIFLTGTADTMRVIEAMELLPQGYLLKPCSEEKLFNTIENALREAQAQKSDEED